MGGRVVVVGAGIAGMAVAARLAKLGHTVTVFEATSLAGGSVRSVERDGFRWDASPSAITLPAVLRDLFRKSGRPIEQYLPLRLRTPARRHIFADGAVVDLPTGSRADQIRAVDDGLGNGAGTAWTGFVDSQADVWDRFRRSPAGPDSAVDLDGVAAGAPPVSRGSIARLLRRSFADERLREMVGYRFVMSGSPLRRVPAAAAASVYVDRSFGVWSAQGGLVRLSQALVTRLRERGVAVNYDSPVTRILADRERLTGIELESGGFVAADLAVAAIDPLTVFCDLASGWGGKPARVFRSASRVDRPSVTYLGLEHDNADGSPPEMILHGDPLITVETDGAAALGYRAWTVRRRGDGAEDVLTTLAKRGIDVRNEVVVRVDEVPAQTSSDPQSKPYEIAWDGDRAQRRRVSCANPISGLYVLSAGLSPGASIPEVCWTAARIANQIGKV